MKKIRRILCVIMAAAMTQGVVAVKTETALAATSVANQEELYNAILNGGTYELSDNITIDGSWAVPVTGNVGKAAVTIDLNGHNITAEGYTGRFVTTAAYQARRLTLTNSQTIGGVISGFATDSDSVFRVQLGGLYIRSNVTVSGCGNASNPIILTSYSSQYSKIIEIEGTISNCTASDIIRAAIPSGDTKKMNHTINIKPGADLTDNTISGSTINILSADSVTGTNTVNITGGKLEGVTVGATTATLSNGIIISGGYVDSISLDSNATSNITGGWFRNITNVNPASGYTLARISIRDDDKYTHKVIPNGATCNIEYYNGEDKYDAISQTNEAYNAVTVAAAQEKAGSEFQVWNTSPDGNGMEFAPGSAITGYDGQTIKLYAMWDAASEKAVQVTINGYTAQYDNIADAWAAARTTAYPATIKLNQDCATAGRDELYNILSALGAGMNVTLDLNGHTFSTGSVYEARFCKFIDVTGGAVLTVTDTSVGQTGLLIKNYGGNTTNGGAMIRVTGSGSTLNIAGGKIQSNYSFGGACVLHAASNGTINICGGKVYYGGASTAKPYLLAASGCTITATGGEFSFDPTEYSVTVAAGHKAEEGASAWTVRALYTYDVKYYDGETEYAALADVATEDETFTIAEDQEKENSVFAGWNTRADGEGTGYSAGQEVVFTEDTNLYAQWLEATVATHDIFYFNGETALTELTDAGVTEGASTMAAAAVSKANTASTCYTFSEWNTSPDGEGTGYAAGAPIVMGEGNITLYAIFDETPTVVQVTAGGADSYYANLATAWSDAVLNKTATVTLLDDAVIKSILPSFTQKASAITIDLNGSTLTVKDCAIMKVVGGTLTIKDGDIVATGDGISSWSGVSYSNGLIWVGYDSTLSYGNLTLDGVTIDVSDYVITGKNTTGIYSYGSGNSRLILTDTELITAAATSNRSIYIHRGKLTISDGDKIMGTIVRGELANTTFNLTGGKYSEDPSEFASAGYGAAAVDEDPYFYQIGVLEASASISGSVFDNAASFTISTTVKDNESGDEIGSSTQAAQTITLSGTAYEDYEAIVTGSVSKTPVGAANLAMFDEAQLSAVVKESYDNAGEQAADITDIKVVIVSDSVTEDFNGELPTLTYEVHPEVISYNNGGEALGSVALGNSLLGTGAYFTIKLPVSNALYNAAMPTDGHRYVSVSHVSPDENYEDETGNYEIKGVEDGYYILCGVTHFSEFELEPVTIEVAAAVTVSASISLHDSIKINFYVNGLEDSPAYYTVRYTFGGEVTEVVLDDSMRETDGSFKFVAAECAARQMNDTVDFCVKYKGTEIFHMPAYSIRMYCERQLSGTVSDKLRNICLAVLDYGAAAQNYFGYRQDNLANSTYSADAIDSTVVPAFTTSATRNGDIVKMSASLSLKARTELNFYIYSDGSISTTPTVTVGGEGWANLTFDLAGTSGGVRVYKLTIKGLASSMLGQNVVVSVTTDASGEGTVTYSPMAYACRNQNKDGALGTVCKALYNYYVAAGAYFN